MSTLMLLQCILGFQLPTQLWQYALTIVNFGC